MAKISQLRKFVESEIGTKQSESKQSELLDLTKLRNFASKRIASVWSHAWINAVHACTSTIKLALEFRDYHLLALSSRSVHPS